MGRGTGGTCAHLGKRERMNWNLSARRCGSSKTEVKVVRVYPLLWSHFHRFVINKPFMGTPKKEMLFVTESVT